MIKNCNSCYCYLILNNLYCCITSFIQDSFNNLFIILALSDLFHFYKTSSLCVLNYFNFCNLHAIKWHGMIESKKIIQYQTITLSGQAAYLYYIRTR